MSTDKKVNPEAKEKISHAPATNKTEIPEYFEPMCGALPMRASNAKPSLFLRLMRTLKLSNKQ